jgi:hypothetical protein
MIRNCFHRYGYYVQVSQMLRILTRCSLWRRHVIDVCTDLIKMSRSGICYTCQNVSNAIKSCGRCKNVKYCSRTCQIDDWPSHKETCNTTLKKTKTKINKSAVSQTINRQWSKEFFTSRHELQGRIYCTICGDTEDRCELTRTRIGILCIDCVKIQTEIASKIQSTPYVFSPEDTCK